MSRSNPNASGTPNPATRWFEWNGEGGVVRYYDKETKQNVDVGSDFTFLLLDELGSVRGFHEPSNSGIYSNEVKDTRQDVLVVKSSKGGTLAEGVYRDIKDKVARQGGHFVSNCYIAFKNGGGQLSIGSLRFKGSALGAWMEFRKKNRDDLYKKAIRIKGYTEGKKGKIVFRTPILLLKDLDPATDAAAVALDKELQKFFASYFGTPKREQVEQPHHDEPPTEDYDEHNAPPAAELTDDDIPF